MDQKAAVEELRSKVKDLLSPHYDTDFNLLRWLQGHDFVMDTVVPRLRYHLRLRQSSWKLDQELPRDETVHEYWQWGMMGEAGKGTNEIVYVEQSGRNDVNGFLKSFSNTQLLHARLFDYERMLKAVMELEKQTGKQAAILYVMDLGGLKWDSSLLGIVTGPLKAITHVMADHYVELFRHFVIINVPGWAYQLWKIIQPLLPEKTRQKVNILSPNWRQEIPKYADPKILPKHWNKSSEEEVFGGQLDLPTKVPESLYCLSSNLLSENIQSVLIPAGKVQLVNINVEKIDTLLKMSLHAFGGDFGFGLFYSENESETDVDRMEMVYPQFTKLAGPTVVPIIEKVLCRTSGCYKLWLSNQHAWWSSAKFEYSIEFE